MDKKELSSKLKKDLLEKMREIRKVGTTDDMQKAMDIYRESGYGPAHSTKETAKAGTELLSPEGSAEKTIRVPGKKEVINTKSIQKVDDAAEAMARNAKKIQLKKLAKLGKGLKGIPLIGGLAAAAMSGDVSAAIPVLGEADPLGPRAGSPSAILEDPDTSMEMKKRALEMLKRGEE